MRKTNMETVWKLYSAEHIMGISSVVGCCSRLSLGMV